MAKRGIENNCPYCGRTIRIKSAKTEHAYGSPVRQCEFCKKTYIDRYYRELALEDADKIDRRKLAPKNAGMLLFGALLILLGYFLFPGEKDIIIRVLMMALGGLLALAAAFVIVTEYRTYDARMKFFEEELSESEKRLKDPEYAQKLKNAGYRVPERYL
ncbi:MAG TPA: hypothetical protein VN366_10820 [Feifaniaceae bacterium]|nr:hypothetical protein [Feifaniaceae bacterium]